MISNNFKIITLCGSTKFKKEFEEIYKKLSLEGNIVLTVACFGHVDSPEVFKIPGLKDMLDEMHKEKIRMSDGIFVINPNNYIGNSTKNEIEYAKSLNKDIQYLEDPIFIERYTLINNVAKIHGIKLHLECEEEPKNHASSDCDKEIFMGIFDDADILTIAFFHELAHCLSQAVLVHRKYCSSRLADEGFAWEYGFELAARHGYTWDIKHKVYKYAEKNLLSYVTNETMRTCINCKRSKKFDDNFIKCNYDNELIHVSMTQEMADGCLQYLPKE